MFKRILLFTLLFITLSGLAVAFAWQPAQTSVALAGDGLFTEFGFVVVRAYFTDPQMVSDLAAWTEPWEVDYQKQFVVLEVSASQYQQLLDAGFRVEIDAAMTLKMNQPMAYLPGQVSGIPGYACYRTVEETYATAEDIVANYPQLASWIDVGDSWKKTVGQGGYDMMVLRLTNSAVPGPKPKLLITSSIHAREYTPAELSTRFAEFLIANYNVDPDVTWLLDYHEVHLMLHANPDGRKQAEASLSWRKNTNNNYCANTSSRGADLNRNFQFQWGCCGGSSPSQCDETYRGPSAASEPETQAIQNYATAIFPDQRAAPINAAAPITATGVYLDIHSYSELVLWPWGFTATPTGNAADLQALGRKFAYFNSYFPEQAIGLYPTDGTTDDFFYGDLGVAGYTFELGTEFFQSCGVFESSILPDNLPALLYAAKAARTPYLNAGGPDALNVQVSTAAVSAGTAVTLTGSIDDTRYSSVNGTEPRQPIAAAEYYVDTPFWITTTVPVAYPMLPSDGTFNANVETVYGVVDTTGWSSGRHTIFVRGRDTSNEWGLVSAVFLFIVDPAVSPIVGGQVLAADTGLPLDATVNIGSIFHTQTDPASGLYQAQVISGTYDVTAVSADPTYGPATVPDVVAHDYQNVQVDFLLYPYCDVYSDDVESGVNGWTAQSPWAIATEMSHSPTHAWSDSPGGSYGNNRNINLTSPVLDLTGYSGVTLNFWQICDTEAGYDYCTVEVSSDGVNWSALAAYDGPHSQWQQISLPAPQLDNQATARVRFHFTTDTNTIDDGWHIDDISIVASGPDCVQTVVPQASFTTSSPDALGETSSFSNTSLGTTLAYAWDFGDGSPLATERDATHAYAATGTYTVTLTISNTLGTDTAVDTVDILLAPQADFLASNPNVVGETAVFTNTSSGGQPIAYTWEFGDGVTSTLESPTHVYTSTGNYTVTLTAVNPVGTASHTTFLTVGEASVPLVPGESVTLVYTATNGSQVSLTIPGDAMTQTYQLLLTTHDDITPPDAHTGYAGLPMQLTAYQNGVALPDLAFASPMQFALQYTDAQIMGLDEANLWLWRWDGTTWSDVNATCATPTGYTRDLPGNSLEVGLCQTGTYTLFGLIPYYLYLPVLIAP